MAANGFTRGSPCLNTDTYKNSTQPTWTSDRFHCVVVNSLFIFLKLKPCSETSMINGNN